MEYEKTVKYKSKKFSVRIVNLYKYLCDKKNEYVLSKQILRSGTSIGANIAESECAISKKDFLSKIYIALKESAETLYWLDLLYKLNILLILNMSHYMQIVRRLKRCCLPQLKQLTPPSTLKTPN